jgi:hypothetical protein
LGAPAVRGPVVIVGCIWLGGLFLWPVLALAWPIYLALEGEELIDCSSGPRIRNAFSYVGD